MNRSELPAVPSAPKTKGLGWPAFLLALTMAGALAHVGVRLHGLELAYDLARQRKVQSALEEQRRRLQTEIGMLKDPTRIVALARDRLHMGPALPEDIRHLRPGMSLRPTPAVEAAPQRSPSAAKMGGTLRTAGRLASGRLSPLPKSAAPRPASTSAVSPQGASQSTQAAPRPSSAPQPSPPGAQPAEESPEVTP